MKIIIYSTRALMGWMCCVDQSARVRVGHAPKRLPTTPWSHGEDRGGETRRDETVRGRQERECIRMYHAMLQIRRFLPSVALLLPSISTTTTSKTTPDNASHSCQSLSRSLVRAHGAPHHHISITPIAQPPATVAPR